MDPVINVEEILNAIAKEKDLSQEDVKARLQTAVEKGGDIKELIELNKKFAENTEKLQQLVVKLSEDKINEADAERFETASKDKLFETYKSLSDTDPQKMQIKALFAQEHGLGVDETGLILDGTTYEKYMQRPIRKNDPRKEEIVEVRKANDLLALYIAAQGGVEKGLRDDMPSRFNTTIMKECFAQLYKEQVPGMELLEKGVNDAADTATAGQGLEWVPAQILSRNLYEDIWLQLLVAGNFQRFIATGPTFAYPIRTSRTRGYCMSQAIATTDFFSQSVGSKAIPTYMGTNVITFTAQKYGVITYLSDELEQDSVFPILQALYGDLAYGAADGLEDAVLNGSSTAALNDLDNAGTDTNKLWANTSDQGDGIRLNTKTSDARYLWDGIRKKALVSSTAAISPTVSSSSFARSECLSTRKTMLKYGVDPSQLFMVVGPQTYASLLGFPEVSTMEKYAANATVLRGELARMDNIPIIVSPRMYENLDNLGTFTNGTVVSGSSGVKTKKSALYIHRDAYAFADRMTLKVESQREILSQQRAIVASMRLSFNKMFLNTEPTESLLYNIA